jgi:Cysteine-rich CPXCG
MQPFADEHSQLCPYCGEEVEVEVDPLGPSEERYVEDCPVCCRPWTVHVVREEEAVSVYLGREDD